MALKTTDLKNQIVHHGGEVFDHATHAANAVGERATHAAGAVGERATHAASAVGGAAKRQRRPLSIGVIVLALLGAASWWLLSHH